VPQGSTATHLRPVWVEARPRGPLEQSGVMVGMPVRLLVADGSAVNGKECPGDALDPNVRGALKGKVDVRPDPAPPQALPSWFRWP
jgi:hypothetical protein